MDGWPEYWERMIPMHYATHVVSPCLGLVNGLAEYVSCFGSGAVRDDIAEKSGNEQRHITNTLQGEILLFGISINRIGEHERHGPELETVF